MATQRAFSSSVIFQNILSFLSPLEILNLRRVSKKFEKKVTSFLLSDKKIQQRLQVKFTWEDSASGYEHVYMGTPSDFVQDCWAPSRQFPVSNFCFEKGHLAAKDLIDFFKDMGAHIKGLSLHPPINSGHASLRTLNSILFEWTPNLKHLTLTSTPWPSTTRLLDRFQAILAKEGKLEIPSLETLSLPGEGSTYSLGIVLDILQTSPKIQLVEDPTLKFTEPLLACLKLPVGAKVLKWKLDHLNNLQPGTMNKWFFDFAQASPQNVEEICLTFGKITEDMWPDIGTALLQLFRAGRQTLKKIGTLPFLQGIPSMKPLPVMEKVREVRFYEMDDDDHPRKAKLCLLPTNNTLQQAFPQLTTLGLHNLSKDDNPLFRALDTHHHDGVTTVELAVKINHPNQPFLVQRCATLFPNITTFSMEIEGLHILPRIFRAVWTHLRGLEHLKIRVKLGADNPLGEKLPGEMDSAITGFPVKLCQQLRRNLGAETDVKPGNTDQLRDQWWENPSILDLHQLKTFQLNVSTPIGNCQRLFTSVSTVYAFQPMFVRQNLKASVGPLPHFSYQEEKGECGVKETEKEFLIVG